MLHSLLSKIWEQERVPEDWKRGHLVKLSKKGDLSSHNWRGIMLLSNPGKVLTRIMPERLKTALDKRLRVEQAGSDKIARAQTTLQPCASSSSSPWSGRPLCTQSLSTFRKHSTVSTEMSSGDWCTTTAFHQSSLPSSNNFMKMPPVKWSTTGNWWNLSAYKLASVRAVCSLRRSSWWWSTGSWGSPQQARGRASSGPSQSSWRTWTLQTTSAFSPTSSKMHRRSFVRLHQKLRRLDSRSTLGRPRPWQLTTNRMIHCDYTRRTSRRLTSLSTWAV